MATLSAYFSASRAYLIAIEAYKSARLRTPVNDVTTLAATLLKHDFIKETITTKINLTKPAFENLIRSMQNEVGSDDRVLFYFAGHGIAQESASQPKGYLLPVDADMMNAESFVDMRWLMQELSSLPCRHFLLILDCCFAGTVRWAENFRGLDLEDVRTLYKEKFERFINDRSWQVITSSSDNEKALDSLINIGYRGTEKQLLSPFASILIYLLNSPTLGRSRFPDGVITTTRLYNALDEDFAAFVLQNFHLFFGRSETVEELTRLISDSTTKHVVVTGASGVGKTSLIQAGVKPALVIAYAEFIITRPSQIRTNPLLYSNIQTRRKREKKFYFFIDQYEELITVCNEHERRKWIELLQTICEHYQAAKIIIGIRNDFETEMQDLLTGLLPQSKRFVVPPLQRRQIKEIIVKPASQLSAEIQATDNTPEATENFIDKIIDEALQSPGSLPLLSFALEKWFAASVEKSEEYWILSEKTFWDLGGIGGALRNIMKGLVDKLLPFQREVLKNILGRMVSVNENNFTRKKVYEEELQYSDSKKRIIAAELIEQMIGLRIIVTNRGGENSYEKVYYEPAHDAVISSWPQLLFWLNERRDKLYVYQRLSEDVQRWDTVPRPAKKNLLWQGDDLKTVINDIELYQDQSLYSRLANSVVSTFSLGKYPGVEQQRKSFLNGSENEFVQQSIRRIRKRQSIINLFLLATFVAAVWTAIVLNNQEKANQALFINSTAEGNSPSEKLMLLQKAYELDPDQEITRQNIIQLLNQSPSYYSPFASNILYQRGSYNRTLINNRHNGELITIADSSLVWWDEEKEVKLQLSDTDVIVSAGFVPGPPSSIYYKTFSGPLKILNSDGSAVNKNDLVPGGNFSKTFSSRSIYSVDFIEEIEKFIVISAPLASDTTRTIYFNLLDIQGRIVSRNPVKTQGLVSFLHFINKRTNEIYLYDSEWLLIYNYTSASSRQYLLKKQLDSPDGLVDLTSMSEANDFPVFKFSADGKAFFYKTYKDSVYLLSTAGETAVFRKLSPHTRDAVFVDTTHTLLIVDDEGLKK